MQRALEDERENETSTPIDYHGQRAKAIIEELSNDRVAVKSELNHEDSDSSALEELKIVGAGLEQSRERIAALEDALIDVLETGQPEEGNGDGIEAFHAWDCQVRDRDEPNVEYESIEAAAANPAGEEQTILPPIEDTSTTDLASSVNGIPWYLRPEQTDCLVPKIDVQKVTEEKYPDLPFNSPPILQLLVSRLFYSHHLQKITILDLRNRWPPPVWGSETIMILATARTERQLGSVAEATAKWLKKTAGVIPRIDGLPRKETLVIKRRRLRRKAMLKPGFMAPPPKPVTWVSMYTGCQGIVLQLFTEEGRIEYDLEGLWGEMRVVEAEELDMKPRKITPGGFEEDEVVETWRPASQKKSEADKKEEKAKKKLEKQKEKRAAKRRWTKVEKEQARQKMMRGQAFSAIGDEWPRSTIRSSLLGRNPKTMDQRRQFHTSRNNLKWPG
jgi:ribosomal silencing factor RsfS